MRRRISIAIALLWSVLLAHSAGAGVPEWKTALNNGLYPGTTIKLTKTSFSMNTIKEAGTVLVMQIDGLSGTKAGEGFAANVIRDGKLSQKGSVANMLMGGGANRREFKKGDRFYVTALGLKDRQISFDLVSASTYDVMTDGNTKSERYAAQLQFEFPEGYLQTTPPTTVQAALDAVILHEVLIKAAVPATVELGQGFDEVEKALGKPDRIVNLGAKVTWVYKDMKVVFVDGKVADVQ